MQDNTPSYMTYLVRLYLISGETLTIKTDGTSYIRLLNMVEKRGLFHKNGFVNLNTLNDKRQINGNIVVRNRNIVCMQYENITDWNNK